MAVTALLRHALAMLVAQNAKVLCVYVKLTPRKILTICLLRRNMLMARDCCQRLLRRNMPSVLISCYCLEQDDLITIIVGCCRSMKEAATATSIEQTKREDEGTLHGEQPHSHTATRRTVSVRLHD
jgi:hypothetical protein